MPTLFAVVLAAVCTWLLDAYVPPPPRSPHPRFIAQLPKLKADWAALKINASNNIQPAASWYSYLQNHATSDAAVPSPWLTRHTITMYQITGVSSWAVLAWKSVLGDFINKYPNYDYSCCKTSYTCCPSSSSKFYGGDNNVRIIAGHWIDTYDWIYTDLTPAQRAQFRAKLANMFDYMLRGTGNCCSFQPSGSYPLRSTDTDVIVHNYYSLLKYYATTADEDNHSVLIWNNPQYNLCGVFARNYSGYLNGKCQNNCYNSSDLGIDMRTCVKAHLVKYARGGSGIHSSGYNLGGEMSKLAYDWAGCRTAFQTDYFPEIPNNLLSFGMNYINSATPDLQWVYRWGDDEAGTDPLGGLFNTLSVVSATTSWFIQDVRQQYINSFLSEILQLWSAKKHWNPYDEFFYAYQHVPTAPKLDFRPALPAPGGSFRLLS